MLVEEGFNMMSVDASDKMLKYALKSRWERRKEPAFDQWGMSLLIIFVFLYFADCIVWWVLWMFRTERGSFTLLLLWCSVIEEANWLTLQEDIQKPGDGFDAVICLGNSFAHLPDFKGMFDLKW